MVAEVLLQQLFVLVMALPVVRYSMVMGIALWGLEVAFRGLQVVPQYPHIIVPMPSDGFSWPCR